MTFYTQSNDAGRYRDAVARRLADMFTERGYRPARSGDDARFVLNLTTADRPRIYRRRSRSVFVVSVVETNGTTNDLQSFCYSTLVRTLSNLLVCVRVPHAGAPLSACEVWFTTPEAGFYRTDCEPDAVFARVAPIATAHYATENDLVQDLPRTFQNGSDRVDELRRHARELDTLGVLPTPFPLQELLTAGELRHLYKIFGMTGLSYGNLSVRERIPDFSEEAFWMTARGVDKSNLGPVGRDVLLVRSFDLDRGSSHISQPPGAPETARVSVDAVEHAMIYRSHPGVGAIVHVHAWVDGIVSTRQNYPCGTRELAEEVAALVATTPDPARAIVGLKNHGITVTGRSLADIFGRLRGRLQTQVPMEA